MCCDLHETKNTRRISCFGTWSLFLQFDILVDVSVWHIKSRLCVIHNSTDEVYSSDSGIKSRLVTGTACLIKKRVTPTVSAQWAYCQICKLMVAHVPGMPRTFSPHVPCIMSGSLTSGFLWSRWRGKSFRHSRRMRNPHFCVSGKRPMSTRHSNVARHCPDMSTQKMVGHQGPLLLTRFNSIPSMDR